MNKVMLIGNVGKEPDVHYYDADQAVAQVSFATTEKGYTLANGMKVPDHTDWHNLVFLRGLAKVVEKYVHKGDRLYVEGRIRYRLYDDKQGKRHNITEIYVDNMEMLTSRSASSSAAPAQPVQPVPAQPAASQPASSTTDSSTAGATDQNDLPF